MSVLSVKDYCNFTEHTPVDRAFESRSGQTKDYKIGTCCFFSKLAAFMSINRDW